MKYLSHEMHRILESVMCLIPSQCLSFNLDLISLTLLNFFRKADKNQSFNKIIIKFKSILRVYLVAMCIYQEKRDDTRPLA